MKTRKANCCSPQPEVRPIVHVRLVAVVDLAAQQLGQGEPAAHWPMREEYWGHVTAVHQPQLTWWTWCRSCWAPRRWRAWWCWRRGPAAASRAGRAPWSPTRRCWWGTWSRVTVRGHVTTVTLVSVSAVPAAARDNWPGLSDNSVSSQSRCSVIFRHVSEVWQCLEMSTFSLQKGLTSAFTLWESTNTLL